MGDGLGDDLTGTLLGERYRLDRKLAVGGMGAIYAATDTRIDREVAVKVVHAHLAHDDKIIERFRREAEAAGGLRHPNIVQITDFIQPENGPAFLVMELLQGEPLSEVLKRERTLDPQRTAFIAWQVLDALGAAHAAGVVHRDLKPANVFLTEVASVHDVVKVVDFGVAQLVSSTKKITQLGDMIGTPSFMPPEQVKGEKIDGRADLYSLGVVMYGCLAGSPPFWAEDPNETLRRVIQHEYKPLLEAAPTLDPGLAAVIERALSARPDDRYPAAAAMRAALAPWVEGAGGVDLHGRETAADAGADPQAPTAVAAHGPDVRGHETDGLRPRTLAIAVLAALLAATLIYLVAEEFAEAPRQPAGAPPASDVLTPAQRRILTKPHAAFSLLRRRAHDGGT
jgi:serine/threonine-protein kinase